MSNNSLELQTTCYQITRVGLQVIKPTTEKEWLYYGDQLRAIDEAKQWAIGDWLVDGKRHYGDGLYKQASILLGMDEQTLQAFRSVRQSLKSRCATRI